MLSWHRTLKPWWPWIQLVIEMWFSPSPEENWTERHGGCGTKAQQNTLSSSSPPSEPVRFAKSSRWRWLKHTQCSVLLHLGPLSRNFALCYLCQVFSQKYHPRQRAAVCCDPDTEMLLAPVPDSGLPKLFFFSFSQLSFPPPPSGVQWRKCSDAARHPCISRAFACSQAVHEASL